MADLSAVAGPERPKLADYPSASRTPLSVAVAAEGLRLKDAAPIFAGKTTGAGTPIMSGLVERTVRASDADVSASVYPLRPLKPRVIVEVYLSGSWVDLGEGGSRDVFAQAGIVIRRGIQGSGPGDNVAGTGTAAFTLNNSATNSARLLGYYSPYNASKRAGWGLGIPVRIRLVDPATGSARTRFTGIVDAIAPSPGLVGDRQVRVTAVDWMDDAARWALVPEIGEQVNQTWDQILAAILAMMPTSPPGGSALDAGIDVFPYALDSSAFGSQTAMAEFKKLADSERGLIYQRADGTFVGEGRHARILNLTSAWTVDDSSLTALDLPTTQDEIIDTFRVTVHQRLVDAAPTSIVYDQANVITLQPSSSQLLLGPFRDQITGDPMGATDIQALVAGSDWTANSKSDGTGDDKQGSVSVSMTRGPNGLSFTVVNLSASVVYLTSLSVRGKGIRDKGTVTLQDPSTTGAHVISLDMPYQANVNVGQGAATFYRRRWGTAFAQARTIGVPGKNAALLTAILKREISDRITVQETVTGSSSDYFVNGIEERVLPSGHVTASYVLAPAQDPYAGLYWVLGTSVLGVNTIPVPF